MSIGCSEKKIIIMSDTHGDFDEMSRVIARERPFDIFIHCGDLCGVEGMLESRLSDCIVHLVRGNCDFNLDLPPLKEYHIGRLKVVQVHGNRERAEYDVSRLFYMAKEREADIVLFGHTHTPTFIQEQGVTILNPGSLIRPRQADRTGTYVVMTTDKNGDAEFAWKTAAGSEYSID